MSIDTVATPLTAEQIRHVRETFAGIRDVNAFTSAFYDRLFELAPGVRSMFGGDLAEQRQKLARMLGTLVAGLHAPEGLDNTLANLGERHAGYGAQAEHYPVVGSALLDTFAAQLGPRFDEDARSAWLALFLHVSQCMQRGYAVAA